VTSPTPKLAVEKPAPSNFPIIAVVILAALIAGAAVFFLRRKSP
jgi:LPXTG-motif cell wall-anchored protein